MNKAGLALAIGLATVVALADAFASYALQWIAPTWLLVGVGGAITALAVWSLWPLDRGIAAGAALAGLVWFATIYIWPLTPRKLSFRDMQRIEVGISRGEVGQLAGKWSRTPSGENVVGWPVGLDVEHWFHGQGGQLLSFDHCVIRYADERVASLELVFD